MTDKFSIRDILVYTTLGFSSCIFFYWHYPANMEELIEKSKDYSDLTVLALIPFCYLLGHLILGVDDLVFNSILYRPLRGKKVSATSFFLRIYHFLFFGYRNIGIRNSEDIDEKRFLAACDQLQKQGNYDKAEYYQSISDLFKGIFLLSVVSLGVHVYHIQFYWWEFLLLSIIWYRARIFSSYYVRFIARNVDIAGPRART